MPPGPAAASSGRDPLRCRPRSSTPHAGLGGWRLGVALVAASLFSSPGRAAEAPPPLPWRCAARPGFTVDAAAFPDSSRWQLEVYVRIPPQALSYLGAGGEKSAKLRLETRMSNRFGAKLHEGRQEFSLTAADSAAGFGQIVFTRFPVPAAGRYQLRVQLQDLGSRKRGILYLGRNIPETAVVEGDVTIPAGGELRLGDLEFVWSAEPGRRPSPFIRAGREMLPNPERLFGLYATTMQAYAIAEGFAGDLRPWRWHARIFRGADVMAEQESTVAGAPRCEILPLLDVSSLPAGGYHLELKVWREGDAGAVARRARFSIAWQRWAWRRSPREIEDEVHFLLGEEEERDFQEMQPGEQEAYMAEYWRKRDPTPQTAENEWRTAYEQRVAYANDHFAGHGNERGMFTDQGRIFIRYGPPSDILRQVLPAGDKTLFQVARDLALTEDAPMSSTPFRRESDIRPFEVWIYEGEVPRPIDIDPERMGDTRRRDRLVFLFVDEQGFGRYLLRYSTE